MLNIVKKAATAQIPNSTPLMKDEDIIQPAMLAIISHLILVRVSCLVITAIKVKNKLPIEPVKKSHCKSAKYPISPNMGKSKTIICIMLILNFKFF